jgi:outer membrane receptor protein involved in Fe transport
MSAYSRTPKRKILVSCIALALSSGYAHAQQADPDIEEVVVTGSFIRGTPLDAPSPVQVIDRQSIEAQGAAIIWDVIKNLEVNSGSFTENGSGEVYGTAGTAQVNLRNLGENSTLTLINGKRMVPSGAVTRGGGEYVDINSIPLVMTERVEVLTDGGSALYGADAVAGVVNVIMRTDFEGLEIYGDVQNVLEAGNAYDATISGIWGWASDDGDTHFVLSGERFDRDPVSIYDGNFYDENTVVQGNVSNPGTIAGSSAFGAQLNQAYVNSELKAINLAERSTATATIYTDPLCTTGLTDANGNAFYVSGADPHQRGGLGNHSGACVVDESEWALIAYKQDRNSFAGSFDHTFDNGTEFYSFVQWSDSNTYRGGSGYTRSFSTTLLPSPGAYTLARGKVLELGHYAPLFGNPVPVITNNPVDAINGGPNTMFRSTGHYGILRPGSDEDVTRTETVSGQFGFRGDFEIADRELSYDISYSAGSSSVETQRRDFNRTNTHLASMGLGGKDCVPNGVTDFDFLGQPGANAWTSYASLYRFVFEGFFVQPFEPISLGLTSSNQGQGPCKFYNPLLSSITNPNVANDQEILDWMTEVVNAKDKRNTLGVLDAVVTGDLFEMRGGMAAFAVGGQNRQRNARSIANHLLFPGIPKGITSFDANHMPATFSKMDNNLSCSSCTFNYDIDQDATAVFLELSLPFWENVESQVALRWEDYGGSIGSEVSPKVALSWRPVDTLLLRGSWSQSFRAPNPGIIGSGLDASSTTFLDPLSNQAVRAGLLPPTPENSVLESSYTLGGPAPNVGNEYADTYSAGFIWTPGGALEGTSIQADFWRFEVRDRVLPESGGGAMKRQLEAFTAAAANTANYVLNTSMNATVAPVLFVPCNPTALATQYGADSAERLDCVVDPRLYQVDGVEESIPSSQRNLIQLKLGAINAGEITAQGVDINLGYRWANDWGRFSLALEHTFVEQYTLKDVPGLENGLLDIGIYDAAGTTGDGNVVRSLPDNKGHVTFNWSTGNHSVTAITRYIGEYDNISADLRYPDSNPYVQSLLSSTIDSYYSVDLQYRYTHAWANSKMGTTVFTVGALDAFNADIPYVETGSLNYDASVFDGRGRRLYVRALWQF